MATVSVADFALHIQNYLDQAVRGENITIRLQNNRYVELTAKTAMEPAKAAYQNRIVESNRLSRWIVG